MIRPLALTLFAALSVSVAVPAAAHDHEATGPDLVEHPELRVYTGASQLVPWCRDEAKARAVAAGHEVFQWTASHSERGQTLTVDGKLHVSGGDFAVTCRIARGAREEFASIEMALVPR